ncbi:ribbon-helix-helix domain-containing protein [Thalassotalea sp. Y01]|uniref:ribbon-helix-helix domain-containing protein n=1 Tax=Thalassotalea sp. Y01 TaxID=2729613 RepID=UPI00145D18DE|nr:ribbon-helix-helix domain-containing protein [Thalassotalea sp. Y01]NMP16457.1 ribbon-helix-helix domain-containing protein [Thalassotalea sp. Y01]
MSLADLKKKSQTRVERTFTVDEFIDDATNYAVGQPQIVSADIQAQAQLINDHIACTLSCDNNAQTTEECCFKHATFTLSEDIIEQLNELSENTKIAKSRILRILVSNFFFKDNPAKLQLSNIK